MNRKLNWPGVILAIAVMSFSSAPVVANPNAQIRSLLATQQYEDALAISVSALSLRPEDTELRILHGVALARTGQMDQAIQAFKELIVDNPSDPQLMNNLAALYAGQGDYRSAEDMLNRAVLLSPDYSVARANLGDLYASMARTQFQSALRSDPNNPTLMNKLNALNVVLGMRQTAVPGVTPAVKAQAEPAAATTPPATTPPATTPRPGSQPDVEQAPRTIVRAAPQPVMPPASAPLPVMAKPSASGQCLVVGPFLDKAKLARVKGWLKDRQARVVEETRESQRTLNTVYIPASSFEGTTAREQIQNLKARGLRDMSVIRSGGLKGAVSLGVFRSPDSVKRRIKAVEKLGFVAENKVETFTRTRPWLLIRPGAGSPLDVKALRSQFDKTDATSVNPGGDCQAQRVVADQIR